MSTTKGYFDGLSLKEYLINAVTEKTLGRVIEWCNNLSRKILGYFALKKYYLMKLDS